LVSHLKRPEGKGHEEGAQTSLAQLRGSAAIGQLSDGVIGAERNQQDKLNSHITTLRGLKNRYAGETGIATYLSYNRETGRLVELAECPFVDETEGEGSGTTE
jgi:twinkle protein